MMIDCFVEKWNGLVFHETAFNAVVMETFGTSLSYFLAYQKNELVGVCPVHTIREGFVRKSYSGPSQYEVPYGGWIFNTDCTDYINLVDGRRTAFNEIMIYRTSVFPGFQNPCVNSNVAHKEITGFVDLNKTIEDLWKTVLSSKRRNMIRKAEKVEISILASGSDLLDCFYSLLLEMNQKAKIQSKSVEYYSRILQRYYPSKCLILIATLKGIPIAGNMLIGNGNVVHYWQGASKSGLTNFGQGELLQWHSIQWSKSTGSKYYDVCVMEPDRLPSIARFKADFIEQTIPFYSFTMKPVGYRIINRIQNAFHP